jgi:putative endonuclease
MWPKGTGGEGASSSRFSFGAGSRSGDDAAAPFRQHVGPVPTKPRRTRAFVPVSEWAHRGQLRGVWGERVALAYLTSCGWSVEAHRYRFGRHDVDLIARRGSLVAFVEVKTRQSSACGAPVEAVGWRKRQALQRAAECWRLRYGRRGDHYRFDLVAVWVSAGRVRVEHVVDAWRCG